MNRKKVRIYTNALFHKITYIYASILLFMGMLASYMAYSKEHNEMIGQLEQVMGDLKHAYESSTENFWRIYMPIFENRGSVYLSLKKYFVAEDKTNLSPIEKRDLTNALQTIMAHDNNIKWIGIYAGKEEYNYLLFEGDNVLVEMPDDFPFIEDLERKGPGKEIYGSELVKKEDKQIRYFALCGGTASDMRGGKIIIGYDTSKFESIYMQAQELQGIRFCITNNFGVVFDSLGEYDDECDLIVDDCKRVYNNDGELIYVRRLQGTGNGYSIFCTVPWWDMIIKSHSFTPYIVAIVFLFCVCSILIYRWTGKVIIKKIDIIQHGLHKIGENQLDYRIMVPEIPTDEFENISQSINKMTARLQENINKTYELRLKQREAELAELQAKFDPHFLYNTLEVIRGKVYENGDIETSDIIIKLAQIFRTFIGSEQFVTIREEIDFCNMYLSLLKYRYEDRITIIYDIESEILQYGIIRNLLQPVLENFFVHGFNMESTHNILKIRGKVYDEDYIWFYIQDNGLGISEERLVELKESLDDAAGSAQSSYGLKNVHRRIKLFYGAECGVEINSNDFGGVTVEVKISKLSCKEHEQRLYEA